MKSIVTVAAFLFASMAFAQNADPKAAEKQAIKQAEQLSERWKLDKEMADQVTMHMRDASHESADLQAQCAAIQAQIDAVYRKHLDSLMPKMTAEQQALYLGEVKAGTLHFGPCAAGGACSTGDAKGSSGCTDKANAEGKAGGCCAGGKAHGEAKPEEQKAAPEKK